jgi:type IV pilus assembly protein PilB
MDIKQLNAALKEKRILNEEKIKALEKDRLSSKNPSAWEDFLVEKKLLLEEDLLKIKAEILSVPVVDLKNTQISQDVLNLVPEPIAHRHKVISFAKTKEGLSLAMVDPDDIQTRDFIQKKTGLKIQTFFNWQN